METESLKYSSGLDSSPDLTMKHLRRRLNQLGYRQHLGVDSVPLVSKVFSDLVHTTVSLRNAKLSASRTDSDLCDGQPKTLDRTPSPHVSNALDRGDHISPGVAVRHESTQTDEDLPPPPHSTSWQPGDGEQAALADRRVVRPQQEVSDVTSRRQVAQLEEHTVAVEMQMKELQESKRARDHEARVLLDKMAALTSQKQKVLRELSRKHAIVGRLRRVNRHVRDMAWRKLSASKEVVLRQQEVIKDLEDNLAVIKDEASEKEGPLREQLEEVQGQNDRLQGLVKLLEEEKSRLQDKVDEMMATDRDLALELEAMRAKHGICGSVDTVMKSEEEEKNREYQEYHQEAECSRRLKESITSSCIQGRKVKFVLATTFHTKSS
ncbi:centrosomal protein of 135 kDa-like [Dunckerocampus dactyliophorus]|uniref:centrosomal protein of 135 kDa-like n=1 Tax=Dunckerocampus dactyliophorus TaxID=161453 RepID=UPI00240637EF|nr:centrosomal protein of 135 kDa-like [Dunckerocampus dactyliophorus]XP_054644582.1 centrosomal protein of 135 kDa-like [Dunckerocampus dactyliophorus]